MRESQDYDLVFEERPQYLFVRLKASDTTTRTTVDALTEAVSYCRENNIYKLLFFRDIPTVLSETFKYFAGIEAANLRRGVRFALVDPYPEHADALKFFQTVTTNRGAVHETFTNESEAEEWLLSEHADKKPLAIQIKTDL